MPGLSQLKKFSADILSLGDEPGLRAARGEKPVTVPLPKGIEDKDDSDDFITGMPEPVDYDVKPEKKVVVEEDFSDIMGTSVSKPQQAEVAEETTLNVPDLSSLGDLSAFGSDEDGGSMVPDLSMFADPIEETAPEPEPEPEEPEISDLSLEDLLGGTGFDGSEGTEEEKEGEEPLEDFDVPADTQNAKEVSIDEIDQLEAGSIEEPKFEPEQDSYPDTESEIPAGFNSNSDSEFSGDFGADFFAGETPASGIEKENISDTDFSSDSFEMPDLDMDFGKSENEEPLVEEPDSVEDDTGSEAVSSDSLDDFNIDSLGTDSGFDLADQVPEESESAESSFDSEGMSSDPLAASVFGLSDDFKDDVEDLESGSLKDLKAASKKEPEEFVIDGDNFDLPDEFFENSGEAADSDVDEVSQKGAERPLSANKNRIPDSKVPDFLDIDSIVLSESSIHPEQEKKQPEPKPEDDADFMADIIDETPVEDFSAEDVSTTEPAGDDFSLGDGDSIKDGAVDSIDSADGKPLDDFSLDDLDDLGELDLTGESNIGSESSELPAEEDFGSDDVKKSPEAEAADSEFSSDGQEIDMGLGLPEEISEFAPTEAAELESETFDGSTDTASEDTSFDLGDLNLDDTSPSGDTENSFDSESLNMDNPFGDTDSSSFDLPDEAENVASEGTDEENAGIPDGLFNASDLDMPDLGDIVTETETSGSDMDSGDFGSSDADGMFGSGDSPSSADADSGFEGTELSMPLDEGSSDGATNLGDDFPADFNFDLNDTDDDSEPAVDNFDADVPSETFDTSDMEGLDFGIQDTDSHINKNGDFELGASDDFGMDNGEFEIPGFSDVDEVQVSKNGKIKVPEKESKVEDAAADLPPNTLSDDQYEVFLKNLSTYPLNVRIAVEELIVKNEFTDEAEFDIVQKVLKKVSARQLASELEKMLDISIPVPRDFERRTAEEYEAYKQSFQYQLKNKIIPGSIISIAAIIVCFFMFEFTKNFIYKPARAASLYKQGYVLLENEDFPQSESKFREATKFNLQRKWFFRYAHGYQAHKQYIRAEQMYKNILRCFRHDKQAGLEYAAMELNDLANYEKAEQVLLREVLDYHVNDQDGILLLGDNYLEWATEKNSEKFDDARRCYSELIQLYGSNQKNMDLFSSRMMRYFIRTDNLLEVLTLKNRFFPRPRSLGAEDWTSLSGYLLEKLYGPLAPADEYLRSKIEDVKKMLVRAVKADPSNPIALYNMGKYFIHMNNGMSAKSSLKEAISAFDSAKKLKRDDVYKNIDSYRLLGEEYVKDKDYLKAMESYSGGISLFTRENIGNGLEGNSKIGNLYADYGDIQYFISGDMDGALASYQDAVDNQYDRGEIRYKIGFIQYGKKKYQDAVGSFMKASEDYSDDPSLLLAMGNTLSLRNDNYAAQSYYQRLLTQLEEEKSQKGILFPQVRNDEAEIVNNYMKASNNMGVTLFKLAKRTGSSALNAAAIVNFQNSLRAWDSMTRNQQTMVRLSGSNLAEQNIRYVIHPMPEYEPAIYTDISKVLETEEGLIQ